MGPHKNRCAPPQVGDALVQLCVVCGARKRSKKRKKTHHPQDSNIPTMVECSLREFVGEDHVQWLVGEYVAEGVLTSTTLQVSEGELKVWLGKDGRQVVGQWKGGFPANLKPATCATLAQMQVR